MGPSNTHNSLGAFLAHTYTDLELKNESVGYSLWSGRVGENRFAVHCLAEWSLEREQRASEMRKTVGNVSECATRGQSE